MIVTIDNKPIDFFDEDGLRAASMKHAIKMTAMVKSKHLRKALEGLFCDMFTLFVKSQGVLFFHQARSHKFMDIESMEQLVEYMRQILGEPPSENDSVVVPAPADVKPPEPKVEIIVP